MIEITAVKINSAWSISMFEDQALGIGAERLERARQFRFPEDAFRTLSGDFLFRKAAADRLGIHPAQVPISRNEYGRPFLPGCPDLHLNVSHSGDWVICATAHFNIGADIEKIAPVDFGLLENYFTHDEIKLLMAENETGRFDYFYRLWTLKESYMKFDGAGLNIHPASFSVLESPAGLKITSGNFLPQKCFFTVLDSFPGHAAAICAAENSDYKITVIKL